MQSNIFRHSAKDVRILPQELGQSAHPWEDLSHGIHFDQFGNRPSDALKPLFEGVYKEIALLVRALSAFGMKVAHILPLALACERSKLWKTR